MSVCISKDTQLKRARLYPDVIRLPLEEARVCLDCDMVHSGDCCPACASATYLELSSVIGRLSHNTKFQRMPTRSQIPEKVPTIPDAWQLKSVVGSGR